MALIVGRSNGSRQEAVLQLIPEMKEGRKLLLRNVLWEANISHQQLSRSLVMDCILAVND